MMDALTQSSQFFAVLKRCMAHETCNMLLLYMSDLMMLSGPLLPQHMPPEIAARQAGRSLAGAPPTANWLLQLMPCVGQTWSTGDKGAGPAAQGGMLLSLLHVLVSGN